MFTVNFGDFFSLCVRARVSVVAQRLFVFVMCTVVFGDYVSVLFAVFSLTLDHFFLSVLVPAVFMVIMKDLFVFV